MPTSNSEPSGYSSLVNHKPLGIHQLMRYALVGITSNFIGYIAYLLLSFFLVGPIFAMTLVYIAGASASYFGNRSWTFKNNGRTLTTLTKYFLAHIFGYIINLFLLYVFVDQMSYPHQAVQFLAILIVAGVLFVVFKRFVFSETLQNNA